MLARKGETMTTAGIVTYASDHIDQARAVLDVVKKQSLGSTVQRIIGARVMTAVGKSSAASRLCTAAARFWA